MRPWLRGCEGEAADTFTGSEPADGGDAGLAATSAGGIQAPALVQGRGVAVAEAGSVLWLW